MHNPVGSRPDDAEPPHEGGADDAAGGGPPTPDDGRFRVALSDFIPGRDQEVVLFNDSAVREVVLEAGEAPTEQGEVAGHVTAEGVNVDGFRFVRFADGVTVYHHPDTRLRVEITGAPDTA